MINTVKKFDEFVNERMSEKDPTSIKLIRTAEKDGHLTGMEISAGYVVDAAKKVAKEWDELDSEQKKVFRDNYYKKFLKLIHKK